MRYSGGRSMSRVVHGLRPCLLGWKADVGLAQTPGGWREPDGWLRHRSRAFQIKQCRRGTTIYANCALGAKPGLAGRVGANSRRRGCNSGMLLKSMLTFAWFDPLGRPRLS